MAQLTERSRVPSGVLLGYKRCQEDVGEIRDSMVLFYKIIKRVRVDWYFEVGRKGLGEGTIGSRGAKSALEKTLMEPGELWGK